MESIKKEFLTKGSLLPLPIDLYDAKGVTTVFLFMCDFNFWFRFA